MLRASDLLTEGHTSGCQKQGAEPQLWGTGTRNLVADGQPEGPTLYYGEGGLHLTRNFYFGPGGGADLRPRMQGGRAVAQTVRPSPEQTRAQLHRALEEARPFDTTAASAS